MPSSCAGAERKTSEAGRRKQRIRQDRLRYQEPQTGELRLDDGQAEAFPGLLEPREDEPVAATHDVGKIVAPPKSAERSDHAKLRGTLSNSAVERSGPDKHAGDSRIEPMHLGEHVHREERILFRNHSAGKEDDRRVVGDPEAPAEPDTVVAGALERRRIYAVVQHDVLSGPPWSPRQKGIERVVGDPDDPVGQRQADSSHWLAQEKLLEPARRRYSFVGIVDVNDAPLHFRSDAASRYTALTRSWWQWTTS